MPDANWRPPDAPQSGNRFVQKLGVYLLGVAIGLIFLGWIQYRKHLAAQSQQQSAPAPADEAPPAEPTP